jgi:hypothetical protein
MLISPSIGKGLMRGAIFRSQHPAPAAQEKSRILFVIKKGKWSLLEREVQCGLSLPVHMNTLWSPTHKQSRSGEVYIKCCVRTDAFANGRAGDEKRCTLAACVQRKSDYSKERGWQIGLAGSKQHENANFAWIYEFRLICIHDKNARITHLHMNAFMQFYYIPQRWSSEHNMLFRHLSHRIQINHGDQQSYQQLSKAEHEKQDTRQNKIKIKQTKMWFMEKR